MIYLLDTNVCIKYLNGRSSEIRQKVALHGPQTIALCSVVKAELFYGAMKSHNPQKTLAQQHQFVSHFQSLPFDDSAAETYSEIRADLEKRGTPIGPNDLLIASIAIANNLTLVTHNRREFSRVQGLKIEDWETS
ncbi:type II toxin-antitoxin system VapC family toxin [Anaerolineales bacterium HSG25]|nr:type II toxin-antitoxin system VapC family toxin [Anaerolineales bacterium HSG25]